MSTIASEAEFSAWFDTESQEQQRPERGTVAVTAEQLTLEGKSAEVTVPLSTLKDIRADHIPRNLGPIPPGQVPITLVYDTADGVAAAAVAAKTDVIRPFTMHVLETLLSGKQVRVRHPTRVGQQSPPDSFNRGTLAPTDGVVQFDTDRGGRFDASNVTSFEQAQSSTAPQHLVRVRFVREGQQYQTDIQMTNERTVSIFGRYLDIHTRL
jgi:helix-turn-helix protein